MMPVLTNEDLDSMKGDIKELKALAAPPQAVKNTMEAVALLLGYSPSQAKNWSFLRQLCNRGSFLNRMQEVQCKEIKMASAKRARSLISPYNQDKIESISKATVQMYNWAEGTLAEVDNYLDARKELLKGNTNKSALKYST
uniref:Dynein heavy chain-like protein MAL7P1.162 isoform X2 n=1 Tax=Crassostrea virginica TaxID=6565 RepID=A0A8B8CUY2_CRAVI|nr:dynein heavy chain-like protein MAL7P1.162 isoform X2 [Crassostrea virginica]